MEDKKLVNGSTEHSGGVAVESPRPALEEGAQRDWDKASLTYAYEKLRTERYALLRHIEILERVSAEACFGHPELGRARVQVESIEYALHILDCFPH